MHVAICGGRSPQYTLFSGIAPLTPPRGSGTSPAYRDDVEVEVHHRLAGSSSDVYADVVAVGVELLVEEGFCLPDEGEEGGEFCVGRVEKAGDVAKGGEEEVAGACREFVWALLYSLFCFRRHRRPGPRGLSRH